MKKSFIIFFTLLPFVSMAQDPTHYESAYQEITAMLNGEQEPDFKRAVFISENAFFDKRLDYSAFQEQIDHLKLLAENLMFNDGLAYQGADRKDVLKYWSAYSILKDTVRFQIERDSTTHYFKTEPFTYDFEDFFGEKDWTKMFVTKLLATHQGNCHSLPYLYKILVEEMGGEAHLSMSPNHTYIKQWTDETGWFNTELTSGQFPLDAWIMASGYIKLEAIQNKLYMEALDTKQSIAVALVDLAQGYQKRFGELSNSEFILKCLNTALKTYPNYTHARILKAETLKDQYTKLMQKYQTNEPGEVLELPEGQNLFQDMQHEYQSIHKLGYRKMPREMYLNWLMDIKPDQLNKDVEKYTFQAPQPFKDFGYEIPVATLSKGKYQEFFDQDSIVQVGTVMMNRFTGQITAFIEYDTVYSEATLEPEVISRWMSPDPKADERDWLSPYNFVQNNPILRVDPDGELDEYFDAEGNYLGSDDAETDEVRIIDPDVWLAMAGSSTPDHETAQQQSTALVDTELEDDAILNIVSHFKAQLDPESVEEEDRLMAEPLGLKTLANSNRDGGFGIGPLVLKKPKDNLRISVNDGKIHPELGTASNIKNTLVHEYKHHKDFNKRLSRSKRELRAVATQKAHSTYAGTTESFKTLVNEYENFYKNN